MDSKKGHEDGTNKILSEIPWITEEYQDYLERILEEKERERKEIFKCLKDLNASARKLLPKDLADIVPFIENGEIE